MRHDRLCWLAFAAALAGCATERSESLDGNTLNRQWFCDSDGPRVTCTAAMTAAEDEPKAYACLPDEVRPGCPSAGAVEQVEGVLGELDAVDGFADRAWACLLTGDHQRHCVKEGIVAVPPGDDPVPPSDPADDGQDPDDSPDSAPPKDDLPPADNPVPPTDCDPESWEPYFCQLSTAEYRRHGVDITFPCEIFDAYGSALPAVPAQGSTDPDLPSCHDGEWEMRDQSWLDSVLRGCLNLSAPILAMCQQAADYAPSVGACRGTGTW